MWENIIQSVRKVKSGDRGLGCILAHTMGLGKTFQVLSLSSLNVNFYVIVFQVNICVSISVLLSCIYFVVIWILTSTSLLFHF